MESRKVTKNDIVESVYARTKIERKVVQDIFDCIMGCLKSSLESGAVIELRGFGTFEPRLRSGRARARNPKTGEAVSVEPHYVVAFRAGKDLKKSLSELPVEKK